VSVTTIPNSIGSIKTRKWHRLIRPWVNHLVACARGLPLSTALVASDDTLLLAPLEPSSAQDILGDLLLAWHVGMAKPLPSRLKLRSPGSVRPTRPKLRRPRAKPTKVMASTLMASAAKPPR